MRVNQVVHNHNLEITQNMITAMNEEVEKRRKELKQICNESQLAWKEVNPNGLTWKQLQVRKEKSELLKLTAALAEEPRSRARARKILLPKCFLYVAWLIVLLYYGGCIGFLIFWIFSRNGESTQNLIQNGNSNPTDVEIAAQTNAYLVSWLGASFFSIFLSYCLFEPVLVLIRSAILPLLLRISSANEKKINKEKAIERDGDLEQQLGNREMSEKFPYKIFSMETSERILDVVVILVDAIV